MANKQLFSSNTTGRMIQDTDTTNNAGGIAYSFSDEHALAQYVFTGCLTDTYYVNAGAQLDTIVRLCRNVDPKFVAQAAIAARHSGKMKDTAALLTAMLTVLTPGDLTLFNETFPKTINNGKMLRNFCQIIRSGKVGRKSFGSGVRNTIRWCFFDGNAESVFRITGNDPSIVDIIKMIRPRSYTPEFDAVYKYLLKGEVNKERLPKNIVEFEEFKKTGVCEGVLPDVPNEMLTSLRLTKDQWVRLAQRANWQFTRMNLNSFLAHGVFDDKQMISSIANKIKDPEQIKSNSVFPYQLLTTYHSLNDQIPIEIKLAVQDALDISLGNVPEYKNCNVYVCVDISGSMQSPVTGNRGSATSKTKCVDVGALVGSAILKKNPSAQIILFNDTAQQQFLNPNDSVATNCENISDKLFGGTNISSAMKFVNRTKKNTEGNPLVIFVSDNESWLVDHPNNFYRQKSNKTETMKLWSEFKKKNKNAKMVCIDIAPNASSQTHEREDILNIGGFSDFVFEVINNFVTNGKNCSRFVDAIKATVV